MARCPCTCVCRSSRLQERIPHRVPVVNVSDIARVFPEGGQIGVDELVANGLVRKNQLVKVLGEGEITVAVQVSANKFSGSAKEKIAAAGGTATELA